MVKSYESKEEKVYNTFQTISDDYDKLNNVISFNMHKSWKKDAIKRLDIQKDNKVLDVCCGTGDLSFMISKEFDKKVSVTGLDFSENMLSVANDRKKEININNVEFIHGNAMKLPFEDNTFDCAIVGFGLRNTPDYKLALSEMRRVVKPGGRVACLDTSHPTMPVYTQVYWLYFKFIMPSIGYFLSKHKEEYQWLNNSAEQFLSKKELKSLFETVTLKDVFVKPYACGAAALHIGIK